MLKVITHSPSGKIMVRNDKGGGLYCSVCSTNWCNDIMKVITSGMDAESMWEDHHGSSGVSRIRVPLVPTEDLHIEVLLVDVMEGSNLVAVRLDEPEVEHDTLRLEDQTDFIGYLMPGEGRKVIRRMIRDWFHPQIQFAQEYACVGPLHTRNIPAIDRALKRLLEDSPVAQFTNGWTMTFGKACILCHRQNLHERDERIRLEEEEAKKEAARLAALRTKYSDVIPE